MTAMKAVGPEHFFWDHVQAARSLPPERRLLDCLDLYDFARTVTLAGIRAQHPTADDAEVERRLWERIPYPLDRRAVRLAARSVMHRGALLLLVDGGDGRPELVEAYLDSVGP